MKQLLTILLIAGVFGGCTKTKQPDWSHYYHYFPVNEGFWVVYQVDSIAYNPLMDTVMSYQYLVKETIGEEFTDLSNEVWQRIHHAVKRDSAGPWELSAAYAQKQTKQSAQKIENNLRFIKQIYPFQRFKSWSGNSYIHYDDMFFCNFYGDWNYQYRELYTAKTAGSHAFDSVIVIQQVADSGLICKSLAVEHYAPGVGLIYKHVERLTTQNTSPDPFYLKAEQGYILTYTIIDWKRD